MSSLHEVRRFQARERAKRKAVRLLGQAAGRHLQARLKGAIRELRFIADQWGEEFERDLPVNGAEFVAWFAEIRPGVLEAIRKAEGKA